MSGKALSTSLFLMLLFVANVQAQWIRRYDELKSVGGTMIAPLPKGGYVVGVNGKPNAVVVIDGRGEVRSSKQLGKDAPTCLTTAPDGSIFAGLSQFDGRVFDKSRFVKLRADLSVAWTRRLEDGGLNVGISCATGTRDGGVVIVAEHGAATVATKFNAAGDVEWSSGIDPSDREVIHSIRQTRDGGYVAVGASPRWAWLLKLGADGKLLWQRNYGPKDGALFSVAEIGDGSLISMGNFGTAALLMKTTAQGTVVWSKTSTRPGLGYSLGEAPNGVIATMTESAAHTVQLVSIGADGATRWQRTFRSGSNAIYPLGFQSSMLAVTNGQVGFAVAQAQPLTVYTGSLTSGPGGCASFSEGAVSWDVATLREEEVLVERSSPRLMVRDGAIDMTPLEVHARVDRCDVATGGSPDRWQPDPTVPVSAFRASEDTTARDRAYAELLVAGKFAELEKTAEMLRRGAPSPEPLRPNHELRMFYYALHNNEVAPVQTRLARLREWNSIDPHSITAHIALADALLTAGWDIRGSREGSTVTDSAADTTARYLTEAKKVLDDAGKEAERDPYYWLVRISLAGTLGDGDVQAIGLRGLALHSDPEIARDVATFLYPQWGSSHAIYLQFADKAARATSARYGDAVYMWLVYEIKNYEESDEYKQYPIDWKRVRKGGEDLIRMKPDWLPSYHRFAALADRYDDLETLKSLFQRPQLAWYDDAAFIWHDRQGYENVRHKALPPKPVVASPEAVVASEHRAVPVVVSHATPVTVAGSHAAPVAVARPAAVAVSRTGTTVVPASIAHAPAALLDTELQYGSGVHRNISAFLVATSSGSVAVSAIPDSFATVRQQFKSWTMWSPAHPDKPVHAATFLSGSTGSGRGVTLRLEPAGTAGVQALMRARNRAELNDRLFIIVCRREGKGCKEKTLSATVANEEVGAGGARTYVLDLDEAVAESEAQGAAVVNERREVLAVVTSRTVQPGTGKVTLYGESLQYLVPGI